MRGIGNSRAGQSFRRRRRRAALGEFLRVVQDAGSTPELIQSVADRRFYMKCCAALTKADSELPAELLSLRGELEQEARRLNFRPDDIKKRLVSVAGVLGLGSPHGQRQAVQSDYYRRLGIGTESGDEEVHKAYRRLARQTHPDAEGGEKNKFLAVHEAYEVLADPARRRQYDASREHAMHLEWSENARPPGAGSAEKTLPEDPRVLKNVYFIAGVVVFLVAVAFLVDAVIH